MTDRRTQHWKERALSAEGLVILLRAQNRELRAHLTRKAVVIPLPVKEHRTGAK